MNVIRKKESKKKSIQKKTSSTQEASQVPAIHVEEEKPLDFGGLPDRDFKKNLGCG